MREATSKINDKKRWENERLLKTALLSTCTRSGHQPPQSEKDGIEGGEENATGRGRLPNRQTDGK